MSLELSTAGITVSYACESTAGTRPTTASSYTQLTGIKSIPDMNPEPSSLQVTDLSDTRFHRYIKGLMDMGGNLGFNLNLNQANYTTWEAMVTASETAKATGKATWYVINVPGLTNAFYFAGDPASLGMPAAEVDSVLEATGYIAPNQVSGWAAKPST